MKPTPSKVLGWFLTNSSLLISDFDVNPAHPTPEFYWDTVDVHGSLLGMSNFYTMDGRFDRRKFNSPWSLARCIMAIGGFGPILMLPPHQAELLTKLNRLLESRRPVFPIGGPDEFLKDALQTSALESEPGEQNRKWYVQDLIKSQLGSADALFKAIQSVDPWRHRLSMWKNERLLEFHVDEQFDYSRALASRTFAELRDALNRERPNVPVNNWTDAMALCFLEHLKRRALLEAQPLPLFQLSNETLRKASESIEDQEFLRYRLEGKKVSILRGPDYYLMRANLWPPSEERAGMDENRERLDRLRHMRDEITASTGSLSADELLYSDGMHEIGDELASQIDQLRKFWFLDRVWLPFAAQQELTDSTARYLREAQALAGSEAYRSTLRREMDELRNQVGQSTRRFSEMYMIWSSLSRGLALLVARCSNTVRPKKVKAMKLFGLVRFGFPEELEVEVEKMFSRLIDEKQEVVREAVNILSGQIYAALSGKRVAQSDLVVIAACLWMMEADGLLERVYRSESAEDNQECPIWLMIVYGASALRTRKIAAVADVIRKLERTANTATMPTGQTQAMIGVAYLNFNLWSANGGVHFWHLWPASQGTQVNVHRESLAFMEAIAWARRAKERALATSHQYVYALNQLIFYVVEGASDSRIHEIKAEVLELLQFRERDEVWQYRFSDTLARYYHRLAIMEGSEKSPYWNMAIDNIEEAAKEGLGDRNVMHYREVLLSSAPKA